MQDSTGSRDSLLKAGLCNLSSFVVPVPPRVFPGVWRVISRLRRLVSSFLALPQLTVLAPAMAEPPVITDLESQNKSVALPDTWVNAFGGHVPTPMVDRLATTQTTVIAPCNA